MPSVQKHGGNTKASELFGHFRKSFFGIVAAKKGNPPGPGRQIPLPVLQIFEASPRCSLKSSRYVENTNAKTA